MPDLETIHHFDVIIVGSGGAGLILALSLPHHYNIAILAKAELTEASTYYAQGGVAAVLDETDSGLDIDALKIIAEGIKNYRNKNRSFILITHYHRILDFLNPDHVHILINGEIALSGDPQLAKDLEKQGYSWIREMKVK